MNSLSNTSLSTAQLIGRAERTLANCEAESMITTAIELAQSRPGRPREISVKAYLVALLVLGQEGRMHLIRVVRLLNQLDAPTRRRLGITRTEAITRRQVENIHHVITRALGTQTQITPDIFSLQAAPGDLFLLCSDGLTRELTDPQIAAALALTLPLDQICDRLVQGANKAGGQDNITCILVRAEA